MKLKELKLDDRSGFKMNLLTNLNYYGNLDTKQFGKSVKKIIASVAYEEAKCVSYHPDKEELRAAVHIKNQTGYLGDHCQSGSYEYVRFYIDYENDGTWVDLGLSSFKIHDMEDHKGLCYGVKLKIDPEVQRKCNKKPVLPNVRAILSWNIAPPINTPNYIPVWGNVKEARIQIAPKPPYNLTLGNLNGIKETASFVKPGSLPKFDLLKKEYNNQVDGARMMSMALKSADLNMSLKDVIKAKNEFGFANINLLESLEILKNPKFNTTYEELKCVALNRKFNELHADIHIKKGAGYSGNLCSNGSKEYVAFYLDFGSGWKFMGTSSVTVHDINSIPKEGLWYNVALPVNLTPYQKEYCKEGKAQIKGILSWNTPPTPNNPNYVATWGDWEICNVEIKPLPKGYTGTTNQPWIESVGGVDTDIINQTTGLAKGPSGMANSIVADYSPFDGNVYVTGMILNQTLTSKYRVMLKQPGGSFLPFNNNFNVRVTTFDTLTGTSSNATVTQTPSGGFYNYLPKSTGVVQKHVNDDILALLKPTDSGMYELYIESDTGEVSDTISFMVDKDVPTVEIDITSGSGNCGKFSIGDVIEGTFEVKGDRHLDYVRLSLAPHSPTGIIQTAITSATDITSSSGNIIISIEDEDSLEDTVKGTWSIDTTSLPACGYTIHIRAEDRTIVNSSYVGKYSRNASRGFCLEA